MNKTAIEWADYTWNPVTGCLGPRGDGVRCSYCYAHRLAKGRLRERYLRNNLIVWSPAATADPFAPRWAGGLLDPMGKKPSRIFVCSMGDLFGDWMPDEWIHRVLNTVCICPQHTFMFLTKWPQNLAQFNPWPSNCWVGATATDASSALHALCQMENVQAPVRFLSLEPLLGPLDPQRAWPVEWIIVGAQTGVRVPAAPRREWVETIARFAKRHKIALFEKNNLKLLAPCQEFPND